MCVPIRLTLLTALALAATPASPAAGPPLSPTRAGAGELDEKKSADLASLEAELKRLRADTAESFRSAQKTIDELKKEVARLRKEVEELRKRRPPSTRISRSPAAGGSATIRLVNSYADPVTVVVNGTAYRLEPGETRLLRDRAPGRFTYEVPGVREAVDRELRAGETFTIHVHPD
jgi:TolA-binding protein